MKSCIYNLTKTRSLLLKIFSSLFFLVHKRLIKSPPTAWFGFLEGWHYKITLNTHEYRHNGVKKITIDPTFLYGKANNSRKDENKKRKKVQSVVSCTERYTVVWVCYCFGQVQISLHRRRLIANTNHIVFAFFLNYLFVFTWIIRYRPGWFFFYNTTK